MPEELKTASEGIIPEERYYSAGPAEEPVSQNNRYMLSGDDKKELFQQLGILPPVKDDPATELFQSTAFALKQGVRDMGTTLKSFTGIEGIEDMGNDWIATSQQQAPYEGYDILSLDVTDIARTLGQGVGSSLPAVGTGIVAGVLSGGNPIVGTGAMFATSFTQIYGNEYNYFANQYPSMSEGEIKAISLASALPQAAVEVGLGPESLLVRGTARKLGTKSVTDFIRRGALKAIGKKGMQRGGTVALETLMSAGEEGIEEWTQNLWHQTADAFASGDISKIGEAFDPKTSAENIVGGFIGGMGMSGPIATSQQVGKSISKKKPKNDYGITSKDLTSEKPLAPQDGKSLEDLKNVSPDHAKGNTVVQFPEKHFEATDETDEKLTQRLNTQYNAETEYKILKPKTKTKTQNALSGMVKRLTGGETEGYDTVFFADNKSNDPDVPFVSNGFIDHESKKVYVNVGEGVEINPVSIAGHEFAHQLKTSSPEDYKFISDKIENALNDDYKKILETQQAAITEKGSDLNIKEEFYNNVIGDQFTKESFWTKVFEGENDSTIKRIGQSIVKTVRRMKSYLDGSKYGDKAVIRGLDEVENALVKVVRKQLQKQKAEPKAPAQVTPKGTVVHTPANTPFKISETKVVDASELITSSSPNYNQALQPRNRDSVASQEQIQKISQNLNFDLLADSQMSDSGAPIIANDNMVLSGNGRSEAIKQAYSKGSAAEYRSRVEEYAAKNNIDISGIKNPVLVRALDQSENPRISQFVEESNQGNILARNQSELAISDSKILSANNMAIMDKFSQDEKGNVNTAANKEFLNEFVNEIGGQGLMRSDGGFTDEIEDRVGNAVLATIAGMSKEGDKKTIIRLIENKKSLGLTYPVKGILSNAKGLINIMKNKPEYDLLPYVSEALNHLMKFKEAVNRGEYPMSSEGVDAYLNQGDMFSDESIHPFSESILRVFVGNPTYTGVNDFLKGTIREIESETESPNLFGEQKDLGDIIASRTEKEAPKPEAKPAPASTEENITDINKAFDDIKNPQLWNIPVDQEYKSAKTSINSKKLPAGITKAIDNGVWHEGMINIDIGGGSFDNTTEAINKEGAKNYTYDPFNRTVEENLDAIENAGEGKADTVTIHNTLNVIKEQKYRDRILRQAWNALKPGGTVMITVYNSDKSGVGKPTREGESWQENKPLSAYMPLIRRHFKNVKIVNGVATAKKVVQKVTKKSTEKVSKNDYLSSLSESKQAEAARLKKSIKKKLSRMNMGVDPRLVVDGVKLTALYAEAGMRNFTEYAKEMIETFGDTSRNYLFSWWQGTANISNIPDMEDLNRKEGNAVIDSIPSEEIPDIKDRYTKSEMLHGVNVDKNNFIKLVKTGDNNYEITIVEVGPDGKSTVQFIPVTEADDELGMGIGEQHAFVREFKKLTDKTGVSANETQTQETPSSEGSKQTEAGNNEANTQEPQTENAKKQVGASAPESAGEGSTGVSLKDKITNNILESLRSGVPVARSLIRKTAKSANMTIKEIEELVERAVVERAGELNSFQEIVELYKLQPNLSTVTGKSKEMQAYSTPITIAYAMQEMTGALEGGKVYESSGGLGMLVSNVDPKRVHINELWDARRKVLEDRGNYSKVTGEDATTYVPDEDFDILITNPPFGGTSSGTFSGYKLKGDDYVIAARALEQRSKDGKAAIIVGAGLENGGDFSNNGITFGEYIYHNYNVLGDYIITDNMYQKQGTTFPVRLIVVGSKKVDSNPKEYLAPHKKDIPRIKTIDDLEGAIEEVGVMGSGENDGFLEELARADKLKRERPVEAGSTMAEMQRYIDEAINLDVNSDEYKKFRENNDTIFKAVEDFDYDQFDSNLAADLRSFYRRIESNKGNDYYLKTLAGSRATYWYTDRKHAEAVYQAVIKEIQNEEAAAETPESDVITPEIMDELASPQHIEETNISNNTEAPESMPEPYDKSIDTDPNANFAKTTPTSVNGLQNVTRLISHGKSLDTVTPKEFDEPMLKGSMEIQTRTGKSIDDYVMDMLNYESKEKMFEGLAAEQIEGIAKAIYKMTQEGKAVIIADETGIGKGRQAAGIMRYALETGKVPVFFTKIPKLFSDMYFDGKAIGTEFNPLMIGNQKEASIYDHDGNVISRALVPNKQKAVLNSVSIDQDAWENSPYNALFTTYSQINKPNTQQEYISRLIANNQVILILDESHTAAGESQTGEFIKSLLELASGVTYLSATYAKRVDNFGVYNKTSLGNFEDIGVDMESVFNIGGTPLQQIVSQGLAESNELIRREKDFSNVTFESEILNSTDGAEIKAYDEAAKVLSMILDFNSQLNKQASAINKRSKAMNMQSSMQVGRFASVVHNFINQLTLGLKANGIVDLAIRSKDSGQKPFIALKHTLESALKSISDLSENPEDLNYKQYLRMVLDKYAHVTAVTPQGEEIEGIIDEKNPLFPMYINVVDYISSMNNIDMPMSPIDYIVQRLNANGISTGEITGRTLGLQYEFDNDGNVVRDVYGNMKAKLYKRVKETKNEIVKKYNDGTYDALVVNESGSTGLSAHASIEFADQRQRFFILAQPDGDINVAMQMFGRVLRTGQVVEPQYLIASSALAAERKIMNVLMRKLKMLTANTTGEQESSREIGDSDLFNIYGDQAAELTLTEYPGLREKLRLGDTTKTSSKGDFLSTVMGRMAILPNAYQEKILDSIEANYNDVVAEAKQAGEYNLTIAEYPNWAAETVSSEELVKSKGGDGYFNKGVTLKKIKYKTNYRTVSAGEVRSEFKENTGRELNNVSKEEYIEEVNNKIQEILENEKIKARELYEGSTLDYRIGTIDRHQRIIFGALYRLKDFPGVINTISTNEGRYEAAIVSITWSDKGNITPSKIKVRFATDGQPSHITFPISKIAESNDVSINSSYASPESVFTGTDQEVFNERYIYEGNLILALDSAKSGQIIKYGDSSGNTNTALMMSLAWTPGNMSFNPNSVIRDLSNSDIISSMREHDGKLKSRQLKDVEMIYNRWSNNYIFTVPAAKGKLAEPLWKTLSEQFGVEFIKRGSKFYTKIYADDTTMLNGFIDYLKMSGTTFVVGDHAEKFVQSLSSPEASMTFKKQVNPITIDPELHRIYSEALDEYEPERQSTRIIEDSVNEYLNENGATGVIEAMAKGEINPDSTYDMILMKKALDTREFVKLAMSGNLVAHKAMLTYMKAGTKAGQLLAARKMYELTYFDKDGNLVKTADFLSALRHLLLMPTKKMRRAKTDEAREHLAKTYEKKKINTAVDDLMAAGIDINTITNEELIADPALFQTGINIISAAKAGMDDKLYEYWINGLLSMPTTHAANLVGNTAMAFVELIPQRFVEAAINTVSGGHGEAATFGEFVYMLGALKNNFRKSFMNAFEVYRNEAPVDGSKLDTKTRIAVRGKAGSVIRTPGRFLSAADVVFKGIIAPVEAAAMAYRMAKMNGLTNQLEIDNFIREQLTDQNSESVKYGHQRALELTFQDPGMFAKKLNEMRLMDSIAGDMLRYVLPFVTTPTSLITKGVRKSLLGILASPKAVLSKNITQDKKVKLLAENVLATATTVVLMELAGLFAGDDDDELPRITGTSEATWYKSKGRWESINIPPLSVRIGDEWYSYARIEPFSTSVGILLDMVESIKMAKNDIDGKRIMNRIFKSMTENITNKTFTQSIHDIVVAVEDPTKAARVGSNFISSWVPNIVRGTIASTYGEVKDTSVRQQGFDYFKASLVDRTIQRATGNITIKVPIYDCWGNELKKDDLTGIGGFLWRIMSPVKRKSADMSREDQFLYNWNKNNPENEYFPELPRPYYRVKGKTYRITDKAEYARYAKRSMQIAKEKVVNLINSGRINYKDPTLRDIETTKEIFKKSRAKALREVKNGRKQ